MVEQEAKVKVSVTGTDKSIGKLKKFTNFVKKSFVITLGDVVRIGKAVVRVFTNMSKAAQKQESAVKTLNQALKNQGIFAEETTAKLQEQAAAMQQVTTFGDEEIIMLQSQLINFGIAADKIDDVTRATLDLAVSQGMSLFGAGQLLSKSLGSSTNALSRYGIEIEGAVGSNERLDSAITNISSKFGGQAKAASDTFAGATKQLNNNWGDLQETLGQVANEQLKPLLITLGELTVKTNEFLKSFAGGDDLEKAEKQLASLRNGVKLLNVSPLDIFGVQQAEKDRRIKAVEDQEALVKRLRKAKEKANKDVIVSEKEVVAAVKEDTAEITAIKEASAFAEMKSIDDVGQYVLGSVKKRLVGELTAESEAAIGKLAIQLAVALGKLDFIGAGAALSQMAAPIAQAGIAAGAVNAVGFAQGGQFETAASQPVTTQERGPERVTVEPVSSTEQTGGNMTANITVMLGTKELKTIATELKPFLDAKAGRRF